MFRIATMMHSRNTTQLSWYPKLAHMHAHAAQLQRVDTDRLRSRQA
jgi:hypothetical protein